MFKKAVVSPLKATLSFVGSCVGLAVAVAVVYLLVAHYSSLFVHSVESAPEGHMLLGIFVAGAVLILGGMAHYMTLSNVFPSFVAAIFFGMAAKPFLSILIEDHHTLMMGIVSSAVAVILFSGGLETKWDDFRTLFWKIISLSFLGLFVTALMFSVAVYWLAVVLGFEISVVTAVFLGAVLASSDPAALIPVLNDLVFRKEKTGLKDIAIAESALTDVTGTLLTFVFILLVDSQVPLDSVIATYGRVFSEETFMFMVRQIGIGGLVGVFGYLCIDMLHVHKGGEPTKMYARIRRVLRREGNSRQQNMEYDADAAIFFAVPILGFAITHWLGGSGYLAAFIVGLMLGALNHLHQTEAYFGRSIEALFKPVIFIILGAMVPIADLISYAPIGILAALIFMFVIRPIAVFVSLGVWLRWGRSKMEIRDLLFLSLVRETGAIPAALLITLVGKGVGGPALVAIGMWVILGTLVLLPAITPHFARTLGLASNRYPQVS